VNRVLLLTVVIGCICGSGSVEPMDSTEQSDSISTEGPWIGVLLLDGTFSGTVTCETGSLLLNWHQGRVTLSCPQTFVATEETLRIGDRLFREPVRIRAQSGPMQIGQRHHEGWVEWIPDRGFGGWKMIERLVLERYLVGVVSREMSASSFPKAALEAQAIAARTYTYFQYLTGGGQTRRYHLYGDTRSQAYGGTARVPQEVIDAVARTRGMVLMTDGQIFESFYHSTCGGRTCSFSVAYNIADVPTLRSVPCDGCINSRFFSWQRLIDPIMIRRALEQICEGTGVQIGQIQKLVPVDTAESGHVPYIRVVHSGGSFEVDTQRLRSALSSLGENLRSFAFEIRHSPDGILFVGRGWGHGIGMCQVGARGYALRGANRTWILEHYYPGVKIGRVWNGRVQNGGGQIGSVW